jgi:iron complex outermembrane receptor protein
MSWAMELPMIRQGCLDPTQISLEDLLKVEVISIANPTHQFFLRCFLDLPGRLEFDLVWRYADHLPSQGVNSYLTLDVHLGWRPLPPLTIAVVGQNLLTDHHAEFGGGSSGITEIERSVYGKVVWRW